MKPSGDLFFDLFWQSYPRHIGRLEALKEWKKLQDFTIKDVLDGIERWKQSDRWQAGYIMDARRFLHGRHWEDEVPVSPIRRELHAGAGPVCSPAAVRPEVLERIRMREAARGKR